MTAAVLQRVVTDPDRPDREAAWTLDRKRALWRCPVSRCSHTEPAGEGSQRRLTRHTRDVHWRRKVTA